MSDPRPPRVSEPVSVRVYRLGAEPPEDLSSSTTAAERIAMVELLTRRAWELSGRPWPSLPRAQWPLKIVRPGD